MDIKLEYYDQFGFLRKLNIMYHYKWLQRMDSHVVHYRGGSNITWGRDRSITHGSSNLEFLIHVNGGIITASGWSNENKNAPKNHKASDPTGHCRYFRSISRTNRKRIWFQHFERFHHWICKTWEKHEWIIQRHSDLLGCRIYTSIPLEGWLRDRVSRLVGYPTQIHLRLDLIRDLFPSHFKHVIRW